ncbi:uncharacterized protein LOC131667266 isoform X6 [Phymastichus coffea]|uniref:uncharacterized protein LOC131667266 isoform X6 n=1 Tax=Phymastichus coffea TaxID=108790 RepID=UPI00273CBE24|nr:uncharacterized protein LOC131667266 isoform X6 [Phymastichus coffea]
MSSSMLSSGKRECSSSGKQDVVVATTRESRRTTVWPGHANLQTCFVAAAAYAALLLVVLPQDAHGGAYERALLNKLLSNYNTLERPVENESEPLQVKFGITLQQIIDVDEKNQILTTNAWLKLEWTDYNLQWNESEYGGVKDLRITPSKLWKPDVLMYNRHARQEEHDSVPVLPRALRRRDLHHPDTQAHALLLLQPDRAVRAHLQHGAARLHPATGLRREAHPRGDHLAIADGVPEPRCRDLAPGLRCYTPVRDLLQLHHVHGGEQRRAHGPRAQLSPPQARQLRDAQLDEGGVPAMAAVDAAHGPAGQENHAQDHPHDEPHEGAGAAGAEQQEPARQCARHRRRLPTHRQHAANLHLHEVGLRDAADDEAVDRGGDVGVTAVERHAARAAHDPEGAAIHHEPHEEGRPGVGDSERLEVRRHGGGQVLPDCVHAVHGGGHGGGALLRAPHHRPVVQRQPPPRGPWPRDRPPRSHGPKRRPSEEEEAAGRARLDDHEETAPRCP